MWCKSREMPFPCFTFLFIHGRNHSTVSQSRKLKSVLNAINSRRIVKKEAISIYTIKCLEVSIFHKPH